MPEGKEGLMRPLRYITGATLVLSSSVAIIDAAAERPTTRHEVVLDADSARELGRPILALASSDGSVPGEAQAEEIPGHCEDYENMEAGTAHPVNQEWFDNLTVRDGEKGYARVRAACVYLWGTEEWHALDKLWRLEADGDDPDNGNDWHSTNVPQAKPFSKMGCAPEDHRCQARWGMGYIDRRYDSPTKALRAWYARRPHWY